MGIKETYEKISAAVVNGTLPEVTHYFADDFVLVEPEVLPYGGSFHGPQGFVELTKKIRESYNVEVVSAVSTEAGDELLIIEYVFDFESKRTGEHVEAACVDLFRWSKDGKLLRCDIYYKEPDKLASIA